jgi:hypothetical protein
MQHLISREALELAGMLVKQTRGTQKSIVLENSCLPKVSTDDPRIRGKLANKLRINMITCISLVRD